MLGRDRGIGDNGRHVGVEDGRKGKRLLGRGNRL